MVGAFRHPLQRGLLAGAPPGGLNSAQARRIVADLDRAVDVVAFTIAEFIPRQVIHLQQILNAFPLISGPTAG
jgi:arginase